VGHGTRYSCRLCELAIVLRAAQILDVEAHVLISQEF
jgi:hypothetical protein